MKPLLLLLAVLLAAPLAQAQWSFAGNFPDDTNPVSDNNHGLAVDGAGHIWVQSYYPRSADSVAVNPAIVANSSAANCSQRTNNCRVTALHVYNPDGSEVSFSPLSVVTLPGGVQDTLGGSAILNGSGVRVWDYNTGRGLTTGPDGNVYASIGSATVVYKFNQTNGAVMDFVRTSVLDARGGTAPSIDDNGNMFITGVFPGDPIAIYNADLDFVENVVAADRGFNRTMLALPNGNTAFALNYSADVATIYSRQDEFSPWDSTGFAFQGMSVESATIHPTTGQIWVSAGSPNDPPSGRYQPHTWYAFDTADVLSNPTPTPRDSIVWNNPADGRPRAIAFSPDGLTAYVGEFSLGAPAVQKFTFMGNAVEPVIAGVAELRQNRPNPFSGATDIAFSLEVPAQARLRVMDLTGREVAVLVDGPLGVGEHTATFQADGLAAGVYVYVLEVDGRSISRRMLHIR